MVVCSRCAGIYAGIAIGAMTPRLSFLARHGRKVLMAALCVALFDVLIQNHIAQSINHVLRLTTGFIAGWTASAYLFSSMEKTEKHHSSLITGEESEASTT